MASFTTLTSHAVLLSAENVDTDQIIPARFLKTLDKNGLGKQLFFDWRYLPDGSDNPEFALNKPEAQGAQIILAGDNFGCGSSREHAPWALQDHGFRTVIAPSFADIFHTNCTKIGLLPVVLPEDEVHDLIHLAVATPGVTASVDLELQLVVTSEGHEIPFAIEPGIKERLLNGWDDIALSLLQEEDISTYERDRERLGPTTTPFM